MSLHKANGGVSSARNIALKHIKGEYVTFVDSDDYLKPEMIENLVNGTVQGKYDAVIAKTIIIQEDGMQKISRLPSLTPAIYSNDEIIAALYKNELGNGLLDKLWRSTLICNSVFPENMIRAEDAYFQSELLHRTQSLSVINDAWYVYFRYREGNSSTTITQKYFESELIYAEKLFEYSLTNWPEYSDVAFESMVIRYITYYLNFIKPENSISNTLVRIHNKIKDDLPRRRIKVKWYLAAIIVLRFPFIIYLFGKFRKFESRV
jgi:glycosyltransferase involved in cell wall biosynthesis